MGVRSPAEERIRTAQRNEMERDALRVEADGHVSEDVSGMGDPEEASLVLGYRPTDTEPIHKL